MASIRKHRGKYQVQVRRRGHAPISRTFNQRRDAQQWARQMEVEADKGELVGDRQALETLTLREIVERYRDEITPKKKSGEGLLDILCLRPVSVIG
ncbi:hypothetical protein [Roseitalea sp. MMSF_3504]|uniref:hypothetical protein n=2 Tax=Roseitalea TaxID=1915401 RepID=UPI00273E4716|nr:hypothetical protein [Roseitalea sp. MMSF_3504]